MSSSEYLHLCRAAEASQAEFSEVAEDPFWNNCEEREQKLHRIHAYPAKFPAFITTKALSFAASQNLKVKTIGDTFCGCGTVAFEARRAGIDFWGCDINPVATLIAKAKSHSYSDEKLRSYFEQIVTAFRRASSETDLSSTAIDRLKYWYATQQFRDLARLLNSIKAVVPATSRYRSFFLCAFSNILKPTSRWLTKSIKPQLDPDKVPARVINAFENQFSFMADAWLQSNLRKRSKTNILNANILDLDQPKPKLDMLVTSPPYVTSYEYADLHQLTSLWLGFASDYRDLRNGSIGSIQHSLDFNREIKRLNTVGSRVVFSLFDRSQSIARATANYYLDMQRVSSKCFSLLKPSGLAVFVIGNTEYKGVRIDNAAHLAESLLGSGFASVSVTKRRISRKILTPYRDASGRFSQSSTGRHVYGEEFILVAKK